MRRYLLDSDILSYLEQKDSRFFPSVRDRLSRLDDDDEVIVSILSLYEIFYGISWGPEEDRDFLIRSITSIEEKFLIANLSRKGAEVFGGLKSIYRKRTDSSPKNLKRNDIDFLIASSAIAEDAILVSNDKIFLAIKEIDPTLKLENWAA
jgi:predicted nucleic acid-binding protein